MHARELFPGLLGELWHYEVVEAGGRLVLGGGIELEVDSLYAGALELPGE